MNTLQRGLGVAASVVVLASMLACGSLQNAAKNAKTTNDLKQLGLMYQNYCDVNQKGPAGPADLKQYASGDPAGENAVAQTGPGGTYVLFWNVKLSELAQKGPGMSQTVLGYESKVPSQGGLVVMADASVRQMTADEFKAAAKPSENKGKAK